jgi:hypothetical protein
MDFWHTVASNVLSGVAVALVVAGLAWGLTDRYTAKRERAAAWQERDLRAAADLYRVHGQFFSAWKTWNYHFTRDGTARALDDPRRSEIVEVAAQAEGGFESFFLRVALEHDLTTNQEAAMWCLRFAFKELRYAIRKDRPLGWWRSDTHKVGPSGNNSETLGRGYRDYQCIKKLLSTVTEILVEGQDRDGGEGYQRRAGAARRINGDGAAYLTEPRFSQALEFEGLRANHDFASRHWEWVVLGEPLAETFSSLA